MKDELVALFEDTAKAHHKAFVDVNGEDPDWAIWYAEKIQTGLGDALGRKFSKSEIIFCLVFIDNEYRAKSPDTPWIEYYAEHFIEKFAPSDEKNEDKLALYHLPTCPFCLRVRRTIDKLGLEVELRNTREQTHFDDLVAERGRGTVPVLHITSPNGEERWMPESVDIVEYLERMYG